MRPDILDKALTFVQPKGAIYYLSPRGEVFCQKTAEKFSTTQELTFICGRFEGVDERVLEKWGVQEISIGDFVLSGGEPALLTMLDATVRLIDGVLGNAESIQDESFSNNLLEYPQYTKPQNWENRLVPDVLISGHHGNIRKWRQEQSELLTKTRRPDLYEKYLAQTKKGS
jgi:tRNA (guanine37-N1)-methyltransferase